MSGKIRKKVLATRKSGKQYWTTVFVNPIEELSNILSKKLGINKDKTNDRIENSYKNNKINDKFGVSMDSWKQHLFEYFERPSFWQSKFSGEKKTPQEKTVVSTGKSKTPQEKTTVQVKSKWNLSLMKFIHEQYSGSKVKAIGQEQENNFETMPETKGSDKPAIENTIEQKFERWKSGDLSDIIGNEFIYSDVLVDRSFKKNAILDTIKITRNENGFISYKSESGAGGFSEDSFMRNINNGNLVPVGIKNTYKSDDGSKIETDVKLNDEQKIEESEDEKEAAREGYYNEKPSEILNVGNDVWGARRHNYDTYEKFNANIEQMEKDGTASAYVTKKNLFGDYGLANKDERVVKGETEFKVLASYTVREYLSKLPEDSPEMRKTYIDIGRAITRLDNETKTAREFILGLSEFIIQLTPENQIPKQDDEDKPNQISVMDIIKNETTKGQMYKIIGYPLFALAESVMGIKNKMTYYNMEKKDRFQMTNLMNIVSSEIGSKNLSYDDLRKDILGATKASGIKVKKGDTISLGEKLKDRVYTVTTSYDTPEKEARNNELRSKINDLNKYMNIMYSYDVKPSSKSSIDSYFGRTFNDRKEVEEYIKKLYTEYRNEHNSNITRTKIYPEEKGQIVKAGKEKVTVSFKFPDGRIRAYEVKPDMIEQETIESLTKDAKTKRTPKVNLYIEKNVIREGGKNYNDLSVSDIQNKLEKEYQFKALQYGNSMPEDERGYHTKWTLESFSDLSEILNIPVEQVTINGKLGMAYGARGKAGWGSGGAVAHYEPDTKMINLTRAAGYGSLAHEWGHFMDNILSSNMRNFMSTEVQLSEPKTVNIKDMKHGSIYERTNRKGKLERYYYDGKRAGTRYPFVKLSSGQNEPGANPSYVGFYASEYSVKEPIESNKSANIAKEIVDLSIKSMHTQANEESELFKKENDELSAKWIKEDTINSTYLNKGEEAFARAFEAYVADKLENSGRKNTYLSSVSKTTGKPMSDYHGHLIYPQGEYRAKISKLFDDLFDELRGSGELRKAIENFYNESEFSKLLK